MKYEKSPELIKYEMSPVYKTGDSSDLTYYKPISVLPSFSKILERIMYNCSCSHVYQEKNSIFKIVWFSI